MKKKLALLLAMLVLVSVFAMGCGDKNTGNGGNGGGDNESQAGDNNQGSGEKRDDVIIYCEGVWSTLDPHGSGSTAYVNMYLANQLYEALTYVTDEGGVNPVLAKDWSISEDGRVYTFNLNEGIKFHNGEELKASDVEFSYKRAMESPDLETYYAPIEKVEATGDYTVDITLKYAFAPFPSYTANIPIVSEKFCNDNGNNLLEAECGTGPYQLVDFNMNTECNMTRFDDYWQGPASIKDVKFKVITEGTTATVAFESGEIDFMYCYNVSAYAPLEASGKYNTLCTPCLHTANILMNNKSAPLDNVLVRRALAHCTDRETMIEIAYEGLASPTYLMANTSCFGVTEENFVNKYPYDIEKAKELLAEAGYPDGLNLGTMTVIGGSYHEKYAQVFQQDLSSAGVTIELQGSETAVADATAHDYVLCTMGNGFMSDFAYNASHYTPDNMSNYDNPTVTALFEEAAAEQDSDKRLELYDQIIQIVQDDCVNIPIFNKQIPWVWNKNLNAKPHMDNGRAYYVYEMSWN